MELIVSVFWILCHEANENSDLYFVMDKCDLKALEYVSLVQVLENEFNCHVDVISKGSSNKKFLEIVMYDEFFYMMKKIKVVLKLLLAS